MPLGLHNLKSVQKKKKKRVGRGNASGHGTYSTRGMKGQRSRSGSKTRSHATLSIIKQAPKLRGFKSRRDKLLVVNVADLNSEFKEGDIVNPRILQNKRLIDNIKPGVKILGEGDFKVKNLVFEDCLFSHSARLKIEKKGGKISTVVRKSRVKSNQNKKIKKS